MLILHSLRARELEVLNSVKFVTIDNLNWKKWQRPI